MILQPNPAGHLEAVNLNLNTELLLKAVLYPLHHLAMSIHWGMLVSIDGQKVFKNIIEDMLNN